MEISYDGKTRWGIASVPSKPVPNSDFEFLTMVGPNNGRT
jgi:hypothetical protein